MKPWVVVSGNCEWVESRWYFRASWFLTSYFNKLNEMTYLPLACVYMHDDVFALIYIYIYIFQLRLGFSILIEWFLSLLKLFLLSPLLSPIIFFNTYTHFSVAFSAYASGLLFQKTKKKVLSVSCIIRISSVRVIRVLLFSLIFFDSVKVVGPLAKDIYLGDSVNHK